MKRYVKLDKITPNTGELDFSHLNDKVAGEHGFVEIRDGHLYFEDGTRAKFIGFNFAVRASLPDHKGADALAKRLATLGVNCVRICAVDAPPSDRERAWACERGHALLAYEEGTTRRFAADGLDRFDYFAFALKQKGIYLHFDLNVARGYLPGDGLDYPVKGMLPTQKMIQILNRRLIALQKEYAENFLNHVNPYTGTAYKDEPQVMCVQVTNEDTLFLNPAHMRRNGNEPYVREMQARFNHFLLAKYGSRKHLAEAWTENDGTCRLKEDEDPEKGTVGIITPDVPYNVWPNVSDSRGDERRSLPRFGDLNEFGVMVTRDYYGEMFSCLRGIGVRVPIAATNLVHGACEVYAASEADIMQSNPYWNHPFGGEIPQIKDKVSTDPREFSVWMPHHQPGHQELQMTQSKACGKPFMLTEWNEYGSVMYNSASFPMMIAYACLQDIDGILVYCYASDESDPFRDEGGQVRDMMESFNDPGMIALFGSLSYAFRGMAFSKAQVETEICHTVKDMRSLPAQYVTPYAFLSYVSGLSVSFLTGGERYRGCADAAVTSGYTPTGDLSGAKHAIVWSVTESAETERFIRMNRGPASRDIGDGAFLSARSLVMNDPARFTEDPYYFSRMVDRAMKEWGLWDVDTGLTPRGIVSDTGEIRYDPAHALFEAKAPRAAFFAGEPENGRVELGNVTVETKNDRITLTLIPLDGQEINASGRLLLSAVGRAGNDRTHFEGKRFVLEGDLMFEPLAGRIICAGAKRIVLLGLHGEEEGELERQGDLFVTDGRAQANFVIERE